MKDEYYNDGVTRVTDPFYLCICPAGHGYWSCTYEKKCFECGKRLLKCVPANEHSRAKKEAATAR